MATPWILMDSKELPEFRASCVDPQTNVVDYGRLMQGVVDIIRAIDPGLELPKLTFSAGPDYDAVLAEVCASLNRPTIRTKRESGSGEAMVVHGPDSDTLATSFWMIEGVYAADPGCRELFLHIFHHELCHGHDALILRRAGWMSKPHPGGPWSWRLYPIANACWGEYSANRRSFATLPAAGCMHLGMLAEELATVQQQVREAIEWNRSHGSIDALLDEVSPHIGFVFQLAGYILGNLHAAGRELDGEPADALRGSFLEAAWDEAAPILDHLYQTLGEWSGPEVFGPLEEAVRTVFAALGMRMTIRPEGGYLEVP